MEVGGRKRNTPLKYKGYQWWTKLTNANELFSNLSFLSFLLPFVILFKLIFSFLCLILSNGIFQFRLEPSSLYPFSSVSWSCPNCPPKVYSKSQPPTPVYQLPIMYLPLDRCHFKYSVQKTKSCPSPAFLILIRYNIFSQVLSLFFYCFPLHILQLASSSWWLSRMFQNWES